jgi:outer membrane protein OmpA-like peptidoglycan-associated protein
MDTDYGMTTDSYRSYNNWHWIIALILLALLVLLPWLFGIGPSSWRHCAVQAEVASLPVVPAPVAAEPPAAPAVAAAPMSPAPAQSEQMSPSARVLFAVNKDALPSDTNETLASTVAYLKAHPSAKATISGFHDTQGRASRKYNEALAHRRAIKVRNRLRELGITVDRLQMVKPQETTGGGSNDQARRVDVNVIP